MQQKLISSGDVTIEVEIYGKAGPLVIMAPAGTRGAADYSRLAQDIADAGYLAAAVNPRGAGNSIGSLDDLTMHDLAADLAMVIDELSGGSAAAIGNAFGARVVRCLAVDRPELVKCLVLLGAGGKVFSQAPELIEARKTMRDREATPEERLAALKTAFFAKNSDPAPWVTGMWKNAARAQRSVHTTPVDDWWSGGTAPMLVIQGLEDATAPVGNGHSLKDDYGDRVTVMDIPDAAHAILAEQPEVISREVIAYLIIHHV